MNITEIKLEDLNPAEFVKQKVEELITLIGQNTAVNALSGGVDSSAVTMLGHRALGEKLKTFFIDHGLMRKGEIQRICSLFKELGVAVEVIDARNDFFKRLKGVTDPEEKREAITQAFYKDVFGKLVKASGARYLLQGTNFTDVEETVAGIKRQHNILEQLGIDTQEAFGYRVIEPLIQLRKSGVRLVAKEFGLPEEIYNRPPFPGPALAARIIGEVVPERVAIVADATAIVEEELANSGAFQYLAILHEDRVTGIRNGKRDYGLQIEVRCWDSTDALTGTPARIDYGILERLSARITSEVPGVVSVTYNITPKPPSTIEAV